MVRKLVPAENLLEFHVKQGWGPLCEFWGEPVVPEGRPFPRTNDEQATRMMIRELVRYEMKKASLKCLYICLVGVVLYSLFSVVGG